MKLNYIIQAIEKTHDGTSLGKVRPIITKYVEEYSLSPFREVGILNEKGKEIRHIHHINNINPSIEEINALGKTGMHIISTISDEENVDSGASYPNNSENKNYIPTQEDIETLMLKNEKGEYYIQSHTTISPTGQSITLAKNNQFNETNHEALSKILQDMDNEIKQSPLQSQEMNYILQTKYRPKLLEQNVKMTIQTNNNVKQNPPDEDIMMSYESWQKMKNYADEGLTKFDVGLEILGYAPDEIDMDDLSGIPGFNELIPDE